MGYTIVIFIIGIIIGMLTVWVLGCGKKVKKRSLIEVQAEEKAKRKEDLLDFMAGRGKVLNNDIEKLLGVSDATATRLMQDLEKEGKIRQVGKTGQSVFYEKI